MKKTCDRQTATALSALNPLKGRKGIGAEPSGGEFKSPPEKRRQQIQQEIADIRKDLGLKANTDADRRLSTFEAAREQGA